MRLAYLCGEYPRATDTFVRREVAGLREVGFHLETISVRRPRSSERGSAELEAERQQTHYLLPCSPLRLVADHLSLFARSPVRYLRSVRMAICVRSPGIRALLYQLFYFAEAGLLAARMRRRSLQHIHNHAPDASGYVSMLAAELGGFTYSFTIHGFGILSEPKRWNLAEKLERSRFAICVSHHAKSQAMLWTRPEVWSRYHVVRCGVNPDDYRPRTHEGPGRRLLFVGRLDRVKGVPVLIDALERLAVDHPDVHLDIVGDGPERQSIEQRIEHSPVAGSVTFHGYLSSDEVRERYSQADVFVMSSFSEGIPVVLMEAMACGVPVVAPRITGIPELVDDGVSGLLFTPADAEALACAVDRLLKDAALRDDYAKAGRNTIEQRFNLHRELQSLQEVFRTYLGAAGSIPEGKRDHDIRTDLAERSAAVAAAEGS